MKEVAIITGASGGIGYEIALLFAEKKIDILIVARNEKKLENIKSAIEQQYNISVFCVATDLATSEGIVDINHCVNSNNLSVNYLVNNAGFGDYGFFTERSMEKYSEMLGLNIIHSVAATLAIENSTALFWVIRPSDQQLCSKRFCK